jgi:hypothetical protein
MVVDTLRVVKVPRMRGRLRSALGVLIIIVLHLMLTTGWCCPLCLGRASQRAGSNFIDLVEGTLFWRKVNMNWPRKVVMDR